MSGVSLEQRKGIPEATYDLPSDQRYIRLGCAGCSNQVCFTAKGFPLIARGSAEATDLRDLVSEVPRHKEVHQNFTANIYPDTEHCEGAGGECPQSEEIEIVTELLNDRFGADLKLPEPTAS